MKFIAFTTKGLEEISEKELISKLAKIIEVDSKRIIFDKEENQEDLLSLKTVDDIGVFLNKEKNIKTFSKLTELFNNTDLNFARKYIESFRNLNNTFSLTIGVSSSPFKAKEISEFLKNKIKEKYNWDFTEFDHSNFDIRVFIDRSTAIFSVRLTKESLHHRLYKTASKPGSLKPTVAASMVLLATDFKNNLKIVDNFCGSGTILCEAVLSKNQIYGGDIDSESVMITKINLKNLNYKTEDRIKVLDATKTGWQEGFFDCAVSNLPWDKQIEVSSITDLYEETIREYSRILKPQGVICVIVSKPELFIKYVKKYFPNKDISQFKIGLLGQNPTIILVK